jgi:hypothetical protein
MTMRSIIPEDAQSALPIPAIAPHARLDRLDAATSEQWKAAPTFLCAISPDAFDCAMDAAEPEENAPGATGEAEPLCTLCGGRIGIFLELGLDWQHFTGDGITAGEQQIYDPGHSPVVTWRLSEDLQARH